MKILRSPVTPSWQVIRLSCRIILLFLFQLLILSPLVSPQVQAAQKSDPVSRVLPMEHSKFEQRGTTHEDDTPGVLKYGGYCWRDVLVTMQFYRAIEREFGGAELSIIHHPENYPYVLHDFFATFRAIASKSKSLPKTNILVIDHKANEGKGDWQFAPWPVNESKTQDTICASIRLRQDGIAYEGLVGWYTLQDAGITTVLIRFSRLDGAPEMLINEYLKAYPSSVKESDFHGETWVSDDIQKWIHLLQLHKSDKLMFDMALGHLAAYDKNFFGDRNAFMAAEAAVRAGDMEEIDGDIETIRNRVMNWLTAREIQKRQ